MFFCRFLSLPSLTPPFSIERPSRPPYAPPKPSRREILEGCIAQPGLDKGPMPRVEAGGLHSDHNRARDGAVNVEDRSGDAADAVVVFLSPVGQPNRAYLLKLALQDVLICDRVPRERGKPCPVEIRVRFFLGREGENAFPRRYSVNGAEPAGRNGVLDRPLRFVLIDEEYLVSFSYDDLDVLI